MNQKNIYVKIKGLNYLVVEHCEKFAGPMYMKYTISFVNSMFKQI